MTADKRWVILCDDTQWRVAWITPRALDESEPQSLEKSSIGELADPIEVAIRELGYRNEPVLFALGASWCVAATVSLPTSRHGKKRQAMAYLFEPYVPWAAEDFALDYELSGATAFMVAAEAQPWKNLIDQLESRGLTIDTVAPFSRLALQRYLAISSLTLDHHILLWRHDDAVEWWQIDRGRPLDWRVLGDDRESLIRDLTALRLSQVDEIPVRTIGIPADTIEDMAEVTGADISNAELMDSDDYYEAGYREAAEILRGKRSAPIELRQDGLAVGDRYRSLRGYLTTMLATAFLMFIALGVALWKQAGEYNDHRMAAGDEQMEVFHRVFPQRRVPVGVRSHLRSELSRLQGLRGQGGALPETVESTDLLHKVLKALPEKMRLRLLETRIEAERVSLVGHVRSHSDAERFAAELRKQGLEVPAPSTQSIEGKGYEFRITGRLPTADDVEQEALR